MAGKAEASQVIRGLVLAGITIFGAALTRAAEAKSVVVSSATWAHDQFRVSAELLYDPETRKPDLWVDFEQKKVRERESTRKLCKVTSAAEKLKDVEFKLVSQPPARVDGTTTIIYNAVGVKDGKYEGDCGMALVFHFPVELLAPDALAQLTKQFPAALVKDSSGRPSYFKALLVRLTYADSYPIAAFDVEPSL